MKKRPPSLRTAIVLMALLALAGCGHPESGAAQPVQTGGAGDLVVDGLTVSSQDGSFRADGSQAILSAAGTYTLSGTLADGQILVDSPQGGKITLILNGADISCSDGAPIYVRKAGSVILTLAEGTANTIADGIAYIYAGAETEPDAAIFSKADMVINGTGSLTVQANYNDGITSKDTLRIDGGKINITAKNHGIKGKDYLMLNGGGIEVRAGGDGVKATNDTQAALGYVEINGGEIAITAADDGISAVSLVKITGGTVHIDTQNNGIKSELAIELQGGDINIRTEDDDLVCQERSLSAAASLTVNGEVLQ